MAATCRRLSATVDRHFTHRQVLLLRGFGVDRVAILEFILTLTLRHRPWMSLDSQRTHMATCILWYGETGSFNRSARLRGAAGRWCTLHDQAAPNCCSTRPPIATSNSSPPSRGTGCAHSSLRSPATPAQALEVVMLRAATSTPSWLHCQRATLRQHHTCCYKLSNRQAVQVLGAVAGNQ
jgi:hypothetical protein